MRRFFIILIALPFLAACENPQYYDLGVFPVALVTPPINQVVFGPCTDEFDMPASRRPNCNLHHRVRSQTSPWAENTARTQMMAYGPGELQCWRTLGTSECIVISGPPRPVNMVGPNMGSN